MADPPDYRRRIVHVFDNVKHRDEVDATFGNALRIFNSFAEHARITFFAQTPHDAPIRVQPIKSGSLHAKRLENFQKPPVAAAHIKVRSRSLLARRDNPGDLAAIENLALAFRATGLMPA